MKISLRLVYLLVMLPLVVLFSYYASITTNGPDYHNYLLMIERVALKDNLIDMLLAAKDYSFGFFVYLVNPQEYTNYFLVFFYIILISTVVKFSIIPKNPVNATVFVLFYIFLLAPGLDFAAIRSLLGISFFVWYIRFGEQKKLTGKISKIAILLFSFSSHKSLFIPFLFSTKIFTKTLRLFGYFGFACVFMVSVPIVVIITMKMFPEYRDYYFGPATSTLSILYNSFYVLSSLLLVFFSRYFIFDDIGKRLLTVSYGLVLFGFFSFPSTILSGRILEFFAFIQLVLLFNVRIDIENYKKFVPLVWFLSLLFLSIPLVRRAFLLDLWAVY
ncbi:EpsG family protein [Vibrio lentus]|uniref:EpsG family protein n=1 Tax=Vibrio lentus TaxID=136468 RepID=UPI002468406F|nr:EpsG family protein [Vibrio lentus]MDH5929502.1 EpsG family protein [Vibrio lentus]